MAFPVEHLSPSSINTLIHRCGMQWKFRYLDKLIIPPGAAAARGRGTHKGIETNILSKIESGLPAPMEAIQEAARDEVVRTFADGIMLAPGESEEAALGESVDDAVRAATFHAEAVAPGIMPTRSERWWEIQLAGYPCSIKGRMDIETADGIIDTKTAKRAPDAGAAARSPQLTWYHLARKSIDGKPPMYVALDHLIIKRKSVEACQQVSAREDVDILREIRRLDIAVGMIDRELFPPAAPDSWICTEKWCGYFHRCPFGQRRSVKVSLAVSGREAAKGEEDNGE